MADRGKASTGRPPDADAPPPGGEFRVAEESDTAFIDGITFLSKPVQYVVLDGMAIVEGDINLGPVERVREQTELRRREMRGEPVARAVLISGSQFRWPNCTVPFQIANDLPNPQRVVDAIAHWESNTAFRFVPRDAANPAHGDWVEFVPGGGCSSFVGRQGGRQTVTLGDGCSTGNCIHEIGHVVGLWHEQSREDRDAFVTIQWANILPAAINNFSQHVNDGDDVGPYDFGSIMHYPRNAFTKNGQDTIVPTDPNAVIGQRDRLSAGDISAVNALCGPTPTTPPPMTIPLTATRPLTLPTTLPTTRPTLTRPPLTAPTITRPTLTRPTFTLTRPTTTVTRPTVTRPTITITRPTITWPAIPITRPTFTRPTILTRPTFTFPRPTLTFTPPTLTFTPPTLTFTPPTLTVPPTRPTITVTRPTLTRPTITVTRPTLTRPTLTRPTLTLTRPTLTRPTITVTRPTLTFPPTWPITRPTIDIGRTGLTPMAMRTPAGPGDPSGAGYGMEGYDPYGYDPNDPYGYAAGGYDSAGYDPNDPYGYGGGYNGYGGGYNGYGGGGYDAYGYDPNDPYGYGSAGYESYGYDPNDPYGYAAAGYGGYGYDASDPYGYGAGYQDYSGGYEYSDPYDMAQWYYDPSSYYGVSGYDPYGDPSAFGGYGDASGTGGGGVG